MKVICVICGKRVIDHTDKEWEQCVREGRSTGVKK